MPYSPYKFIEKHNGTSIPFTQRDAKKAGYLKYAACNGILLGWVEICLKNETNHLNTQALQLDTEMQTDRCNNEQIKNFLKQISQAEKYQTRYPTDIAFKAKVQQLGFSYGSSLNISCGVSLVNRIETWLYSQIRQCQSGVQFLYIVGNCITEKPDGQKLPGVHAFSLYLDMDNRSIKFFEANRGEVAFSTPNSFINWLKEESNCGELRVLSQRHEVQLNEYRQYTNFQAHIFRHKSCQFQPLLPEQSHPLHARL